MDIAADFAGPERCLVVEPAAAAQVALLRQFSGRVPDLARIEVQSVVRQVDGQNPPVPLPAQYPFPTLTGH